METIRTLVVDDHEAWRNRVRVLLRARSEYEVVGEASDGLETVQKAGALNVDLIVLDIGLPGLNGIEAAQRIQHVLPNATIVFLSTENSPDVVEAAVNTGARRGFVHKARAQSDLLPAIDAALREARFVAQRLKVHPYVGAAKDSFDIFEGIPDRDAVWLEAVVGLREAQERMRGIASKSPGVYFIFHALTHTIVASLDTVEGLLDTGTGND